MGKSKRRKQRAAAPPRAKQVPPSGAATGPGQLGSSGQLAPPAGRVGNPVFERPTPRDRLGDVRTPPMPPPGRRQPASRARRAANPPEVVVEEREVPVHNCATGMLAEAEPQGLVATYTFDTGGWTTTGPLAIAFAGTRMDGSGAPSDRFERVERMEEIGPRTGKVAITTRVEHAAPGRWRITAAPIENPASHPLPRTAVVTSTQFALLAQGPGVRLFAWPALVGLGALVAVILQGLLAARQDLPVASLFGISLLGCLFGFFGGKVWFLVVNRRHPRTFLSSGACIQGFLLVALGVLVVGARLLGVSVGVVLDTTAPGIFLGMAVGRPGCFLTGCCVGRPTRSRWGLWSSDRRLGIRRVPVQLYEAAVALVIGAAGLVLVLGVTPPFPGAVFGAAIAAYTLARQFLFRLRSHSHTRLGRLVVQAICGVTLLGIVGGYVAT